MRIPRPTDRAPTGLQGGQNPAQINIGVAKEIGSAGRAQANAIRDLGSSVAYVAGAFGELHDRQEKIDDDQNMGRFKLEFDRMDHSTWKDINDKAGERGEGLEGTTGRYTAGAAKLTEKYPISDPKRREKLALWTERRIMRRGFQAAHEKRSRLSTYYKGVEDREITGAMASIAKNPSFERMKEVEEGLGELIQSGEGNYRSKEQTEQRLRDMRGQLTATTLKSLAAKDPAGVKTLFEKIAKNGKFQAPQAAPQFKGGPFKVFGNGTRVPSSAERSKIRKSGGIVVNLDTNWVKGGKANPMVVIPDNATPEQRKAAQEYVTSLKQAYKTGLGRDVNPRVATRSANGRGRGNTIHTEPFALTDPEAVRYFSSKEGKAALGNITSGTLGKIPGVVFSLPHNEGRGDKGAHGSGTNEIDYAKSLIQSMQGQSKKAESDQTKLADDPDGEEKAVTSSFDGRMLAPGQKFTAKINGESVTIDAGRWNAMDAKDMRSLYRFSVERGSQIKAERRAEADGQARKNLMHIERTGEKHPEYDREFVKQNLTPQQFHKLEGRMQAAQRGHAITQDMANLRPEILEKRLRMNRPEPGAEHYDEESKAYDNANARIQRFYKAREQDPALSVDGAAGRESWGRHTLVSKALDAMAGEPKNAKDWHSLIDARIKAQEAQGIGSPQPLTNLEARGITDQIRQIPSENVEAGLRQLYDKIKKSYGNTYADEVLDQAIERSSRDKDRRDLFKAVVDGLEGEEKIAAPPVAQRETRRLDRQDRQLEGTEAPPNPDLSSGLEGAKRFYWDNVIGRLRSSPTTGKQGAGPTPAHIKALQDNPERAEEFERKFNLPAGGAKRFLQKASPAATEDASP